jgi:hypothetical protein
MTSSVETNWHTASDSPAGSLAGVLGADPGRGDAGEVLHETLEAASRHLLLLRFAVFNLAAAAFFFAAWTQGWIEKVLDADDTGLSLGIFLVFLAGAAICAHRVCRISMELEQAKIQCPSEGSYVASYLLETADRDSGSRATAAARLKLVLSSRIGSVLQIANSLVLLGLVGTVIGFIIALSGVDPQAAGDVGSIAPMVSELIRGMSVALYTTLVGAVLHLWLKVNYLILSGGTVELIDRLVARGEAVAKL